MRLPGAGGKCLDKERTNQDERNQNEALTYFFNNIVQKHLNNFGQFQIMRYYETSRYQHTADKYITADNARV